jgi:hypothetical protein
MRKTDGPVLVHLSGAKIHGVSPESDNRRARFNYLSHVSRVLHTTSKKLGPPGYQNIFGLYMSSTQRLWRECQKTVKYRELNSESSRAGRRPGSNDRPLVMGRVFIALAGHITSTNHSLGKPRQMCFSNQQPAWIEGERYRNEYRDTPCRSAGSAFE